MRTLALRRALRLGATAASLAVLAAGCTMAPTYERPAAPVPASLPSGGTYGAAESGPVAAPDLAWRDFFTDPKLRTVIQLALDNNRDLRVAILNIAEAHAQYRIQRAALFPEIDASADGTLEHLPGSVLGAESGVTDTNTGGVGQAVAATPAVTIKYYSATLGASNYELDLWGRVRSLSRQALETYLATEEARRAEQISLVSQVATAYVTYAADRERLQVAQDTVKSDRQSLNLTQARFRGGIASELDVRQAESALEEARAGAVTYTTTIAQDLNALRLLVGAEPPAALLPDPLSDTFVTLADLPAGLSSDVLLRRPDIMEAEHTLRGYNANIGAARANFFPTLLLTGGGGTTALSLTDLFAPGSGAWTFTPSVTLPVFTWGKNAANLRYAKVEKSVAVAQYEKAVQTAFREVSDQLAQRGQIAALVSANAREVDALSHSFGLSQSRYTTGSDTYLNVLTAQVSLYGARETLITARLTRATNLIDLYQALGGGVR